MHLHIEPASRSHCTQLTKDETTANKVQASGIGARDILAVETQLFTNPGRLRNLLVHWLMACHVARLTCQAVIYIRRQKREGKGEQWRSDILFPPYVESEIRGGKTANHWSFRLVRKVRSINCTRHSRQTKIWRKSFKKLCYWSG
jgi:hypothetical protein